MCGLYGQDNVSTYASAIYVVLMGFGLYKASQARQRRDQDAGMMAVTFLGLIGGFLMLHGIDWVFDYFCD